VSFETASDFQALIKTDFGTWRPNILICLSLVAWGIGFGWLGVHTPSKWEIATGLYIVGRANSSLTSCMESRLTSISHCIPDNPNFLDSSVRNISSRRQSQKADKISASLDWHETLQSFAERLKNTRPERSPGQTMIMPTLSCDPSFPICRSISLL